MDIKAYFEISNQHFDIYRFMRIKSRSHGFVFSSLFFLYFINRQFQTYKVFIVLCDMYFDSCGVEAI